MADQIPQSGQANIADLTNAIQETRIHIDLTKTFYSITPTELVIIEEGSSVIWKDLCLAGVAIGVPCLINALIENNKSSTFNAEIFWNSLVGGISLVVAIIFAIVWGTSKNKCKSLIQEIRKRPQYKMS